MEKLTIDELKKIKRETELLVTGIIQEFEKETGLRIENVFIENPFYESDIKTFAFKMVVVNPV